MEKVSKIKDYGSHILIFSILFCGIILSGVIFVYSSIQAVDKSSTDHGSGMRSRTPGANPCTDTNGTFHNNRPLRFQFNGDPEFLECSWNPGNSAVRFITVFLTIGLAFLIIIGIYKKKKLFVWIFFGSSIVISLTFFGALIADSNAVRLSQAWCSDRMPGIQESDLVNPSGSITDFRCEYDSYILLCFFDTLACALWGVLAGLSFRHIRKNMTEEKFVDPVLLEQKEALLSGEQYE